MKKENKILMRTSAFFIFVGLVLAFVSVWKNGWDILRWAVTGLLCIYMGYSIRIYAEKVK